MECAALAERLTDLLEGELAEEEEAEAVEHLASCAACEAVLAGTREVVSLAQEHGRLALGESERDLLWSRVVGEAGSPSA